MRTAHPIAFALALLSSSAFAQGAPTPTPNSFYEGQTYQSPGAAAPAAAPAAATVPTTVRELATRASVPAFFAAQNTSAQTRTAHFARVAITKIGVAIPNWYVSPRSVNTTNPGETGTGGTMTATASIEYPAGTFHQVTFAGSASGTVASGLTLTSDQIAVAIPKGALFFVRLHIADPAGIPLNYFAVAPVSGEPQTIGASPYDVIQSGASAVPDMTMTGTVTPTSGEAGISLFPVAIFGPSSAPAVCIHADSRGAGIRASTFGDYDNGNVAMKVGPSLAYINEAVPGETTHDATASYTQRLALVKYCTADVVEYGINDFYLPAVTGGTVPSATTVLGYAQSFVNLIQGAAPNNPIVALTLPPVSTSTDGFATTTNQTTNAGTNGPRSTYNFDLRLGQLSGVVGIWDITAAVESGGASGSGIWLPYMPIGDGLHESLYANLAEMPTEDTTLLTGAN